MAAPLSKQFYGYQSDDGLVDGLAIQQFNTGTYSTSVSHDKFAPVDWPEETKPHDVTKTPAWSVG